MMNVSFHFDIWHQHSNYSSISTNSDFENNYLISDPKHPIDLPSDVCEIILLYYSSSYQDLVRLSCINRTWKIACNNSILWQYLELSFRPKPKYFRLTGFKSSQYSIAKLRYKFIFDIENPRSHQHFSQSRNETHRYIDFEYARNRCADIGIKSNVIQQQFMKELVNQNRCWALQEKYVPIIHSIGRLGHVIGNAIIFILVIEALVISSIEMIGIISHKYSHDDEHFNRKYHSSATVSPTMTPTEMNANEITAKYYHKLFSFFTVDLTIMAFLVLIGISAFAKGMRTILRHEEWDISYRDIAKHVSIELALFGLAFYALEVERQNMSRKNVSFTTDVSTIPAWIILCLAIVLHTYAQMWLGTSTTTNEYSYPVQTDLQYKCFVAAIILYVFFLCCLCVAYSFSFWFWGVGLCLIPLFLSLRVVYHYHNNLDMSKKFQLDTCHLTFHILMSLLVIFTLAIFYKLSHPNHLRLNCSELALGLMYVCCALIVIVPKEWGGNTNFQSVDDSQILASIYRRGSRRRAFM
jgi:hypothetical protein